MNQITRLHASFRKLAANNLTRILRDIPEEFSRVHGHPTLFGSQVMGKMPEVPNPVPGKHIQFNSMPQRYGDDLVRSSTFSFIPTPLRGMGMGRKMYGRSIRSAFEDYTQNKGPRFFVSDPRGETSEEAARVWESLRKRNYPVMDWLQLTRKMPENRSQFGLDLEDMRGFYKDKT